MAQSTPLRVTLSVVGKFHTFDLAQELDQRGHLAAIFSGYPRFKLADNAVPKHKVHTFPWLRVPYMLLSQLGALSHQQQGYLDFLCYSTLDRYTAWQMPPCDVFVGLSGAGFLSGKKAHQMGARYVCDTGSSHIRTQNELLTQERETWGGDSEAAHPRVMARAEAEYAEADMITVPSSFSAQSFVAQGVSPAKLRILPYGVSLGAFHPDGSPDADHFDVLFAGGACLRKGVPYLLQAFQKLQHPRKRLWFAGAFPKDLIVQMRRAGLWSENIHLLGHLNQSQLRQRMSRSHVLVLPSIEDGFGLVMAQAMACGCPVIATEHTGAVDLFQHDAAGFIVPIRRADLLAERMQQLMDEPATRARLSHNALARVSALGGWQDYGDRAVRAYAALTQDTP